jgi:hypothetical protein
VCLQVRSNQMLGLAAEPASGALFAFGLVYTGMVRPTKVRDRGSAAPEAHY